MDQINNTIDELVRKIKEDEAFCDITFVKGFSFSDCENPFDDYMIAVSTLDSQFSSSFIGDAVAENLRGRICEMGVKFRIYAPKTDGGDGLVELSNLMSESIKKHDAHNACREIKISSIAFDENAMTVYRDVVALMSFCIYEEVSG